jgi:hypothetical protein
MICYFFSVLEGEKVLMSVTVTQATATMVTVRRISLTIETVEGGKRKE